MSEAIHVSVGAGPGKYDRECTEARESARAGGAILMILSGDRGDGLAVQVPREILVSLPALLRSVADGVEKELRGGKRNAN